MAKEPKKKVTAVTAVDGTPIEVDFIEAGSPEKEALLIAGYGMTIATARQIIKEREANPQLHSYEMYLKAKALIENFEMTPKPTSTRKGWTRTRY